MFRPYPLYIGLRYTRAKRRNHFVSFISLVSMLGIALGVTVLITVLSVMNGFDYQIRNRIFEMAEQVAVTGYDNGISNWQSLANQVKQYPDVLQVAPFVSGQGLLAAGGISSPALIKGVQPDLEVKVSQLPSKMLQGSFNNLSPQSFGIVLGQGTADQLGLQMGDKVVLFTPQASVTPVGAIPRFKRFTVVGIFSAGSNMDSGLAYINMQDAQALYGLGSSVTGLRLKVSDLYAAPRVSQELAAGLQQRYLISNWTQQFGDFFKAIKMEKTMMFFILVLIIAVAAFNLVSSLVMIVTDKRPEIAILRTLGASPRMIMFIFMIQGCMVGIIGTILGLMGGVLLALNAPEIVAGIQRVFNVQLISSSVYLVDYLPSKLEWSDLWHVSLIALALCLIATLYPAWQASRTQPAEALRYE